jgi:4-amino-4-deoxy-L-arabinose transferase-like glycosyltransferase
MVVVPHTAPTSDRYTPRYLLVLAAAAAASFVPCLFYHYVGEEGLYTIAAMQMQTSGDFFVPVVPGGNYGRPPLFIWLILLMANAIGWEHVLLGSRLIILTATLLTAAGIGWFTHVLLADGRLAACTVLSYLTFFDPLFYRGWLAYSDPLFAFFVFGAVACAWVAAKRESRGILAVALIFLSCAFLTKALTAYAFYLVALGVLAFDRQYRRFLLSAPSLVLHLLAAAVPLLWLFEVPGTSAQRFGMVEEITRRLSAREIAAYAGHLLVFPANFLVNLSPPLLLAVLCSLTRGFAAVRSSPRDVQLGLWVVVVCFIPYWLLPHSHSRYLLPVAPILAMACAWIVLRAEGAWLRVLVCSAIVMIAAKYVLAIGLFPWYQKIYRGENYLIAAQAIIATTARHPLYNTDNSASGAAVAAYIGTLRFPAPPLQAPPRDLESGYILARTADPKLGQVSKKFALGGDDLYLLCRGRACD